MARMYVPTITSRCADCDFGTITGGERYVVKDETWLHACVGRLKPWHALPGQQVLCVGCLEALSTGELRAARISIDAQLRRRLKRES